MLAEGLKGDLLPQQKPFGLTIPVAGQGPTPHAQRLQQPASRPAPSGGCAAWFFSFLRLGKFLGTERGSPAAEGLVCYPRRERSSSLFPKRSCWGNNETFYEKEDLKLVFIKGGLMEANRKHPLEQWQPFKAPLQKR